MKKHIDIFENLDYYSSMKNMKEVIYMFGLFSKSNVKGVNGKEVKDFIKAEKDFSYYWYKNINGSCWW